MFKIFDRYLLRTHIAPFLFGFCTVIFLFLMQFLMKYLDRLVGKGIDTWVIIQLIVFNIAWMVVLAAPMGVLFSTLMAFGNLSSNHEITIIKASGGSLIRMMLPIIIVASLLTIALFWFNDRVLPETNLCAKTLMGDISRTKPTFMLESGQFSSEIEGYTIIARHVDSLSGLLRGITIYDISAMSSRNIISADSGTLNFTADYSKLILKLRSGEIHQLFSGRADNYKIVEFQDYQIMMNASGFNFQRSAIDASNRGDREMRISDMQKIVDESLKYVEIARKNKEKTINAHLDYILKNKLPEESGEARVVSSSYSYVDTSWQARVSRITQRLNFLVSSIKSDSYAERDYKLRAEQYLVEIYKKYAIPFACFIFVFVGCPLGIIAKRGNFGVSAAISLGFYIFYWACLIGGEKLADRGYIAPWLAMWAGNIIIGILGILLTLKINFESFEFLNIAKLFRRKAMQN